jgi:hypothetical protein
MNRRMVGKKFSARVALSVSVLMLFSASELWTQEVDEKKPADRSERKQETVESPPRKTFGDPCELTPCVTKVLYFSNLSQPSELQDVVNAMRVVAAISRIQPIPFARVVVVKGTPEQMVLVENLVDEIDKAKRRFGGMGYRLDFKIDESQGDKKLASQGYSLVTEDLDTTELSIGKPMLTSGENEVRSENQQSPTATAGRKIDCRVLTENEHTIELHVDLTFSSSDAGVGASGSGTHVPTQFRIDSRVTLVLGRPTIISVLSDPDRERTFQIEVTATRIRGK